MIDDKYLVVLIFKSGCFKILVFEYMVIVIKYLEIILKLCFVIEVGRVKFLLRFCCV